MLNGRKSGTAPRLGRDDDGSRPYSLGRAEKTGSNVPRVRKSFRAGGKYRLHESKAVSADAIELCKEALSEVSYQISKAKGRYLFFILSSVLNCNLTPSKAKDGTVYDAGARLAVKSFPDPGTASELLHLLQNLGLISCMDEKSHLPTNWDIRNAKARRYLPSSTLLMANSGDVQFKSYSEYLRGTVHKVKARRVRGKVVPYDGAEQIGKYLTDALTRGTGLTFNRDLIDIAIEPLPERERVIKLGATQKAIGHQRGELKPTWNQKECGRIYASRPALCNMPKVTRPCLESVDGLPLWDVDYSNYEFALWVALNGYPLDDRETNFDHIARHAGITKAETKGVINPMLHGRTIGDIWYAGQSGSWDGDEWVYESHDWQEKRHLAECFCAVTNVLKAWGLGNALKTLQQNKGIILQQTGARIFYRAVNRSIQDLGLRAGLPLHDGWVFAGTPEDAKHVQFCFECAWGSEFKSYTHVKLTPLTPPTTGNYQVA